MLIELPTADEIDALAMTTPHFEVREFEFDVKWKKADLNYVPCKGQLVLVIVGDNGIVLTETKEKGWELPSGRIGACEEPEKAAKRIAREECGVGLRSLELAGIYDVVWHYSDVSVKRLHLVYAGFTDDKECVSSSGKGNVQAKFFTDIPETTAKDELLMYAIADCSEK
ncbi:MAG: NUDIX domain-containing protein [Thermoplasmata archaeon]|jgi:ADP-ribose pyrophosphatase YjhB (NUDIX family)